MKKKQKQQVYATELTFEVFGYSFMGAKQLDWGIFHLKFTFYVRVQ